MLRFDLIDKGSKSQKKYTLTADQKKQKRRRRGRIFGFTLFGLIALLAALLWFRPELLQPYVDIPALTANLRPAAENNTAENSSESQPLVAAVAVTPAPTSTPLPTSTAFPTSTPLQPTIPATVAEPAEVMQVASVNTNLSRQIGYGGVLLQSGVGSLAVVGPDGANVLDVPGGDELALLTPGSLVNTDGRTANNQWVMISTKDNISGWAAANSFVLFGLDELPITSDSTVEAPNAAGITQILANAESNDAADVVAQAATPDPTVAPPPTTAPTVAPTIAPTAAPTIAPAPVSQALSALQNRAISAGLTSALAMVRSNGTTLQSAPNGAVIRSLQAATTLNASGRSADGAWLWGQTTNGDRGWVGVDKVVVFGQSGLPVVNESGAAVGAAAPAGSAASAPMRPAPANPRNLPLATIATDGSRLNIRGGPGTQYAIIGKALDGERFVVVGQSSGSDWIQIEVPNLSSQPLWVSSSYVTLDRAISALPQSNQGNTAAPTAAPTAIANSQIPTPIPLLQPGARASAAGPFGNLPAANATGLSGKLVFQQSLGGAIYVYEPATNALRQLSGGMDPEISRDGRRVTFSRFGGDGGIYVVDINGANERRIYADTTVRSPKWSPDGSWIVFSRLTGKYSCRNVGFGICLQNNPTLAQVVQTNPNVAQFLQSNPDVAQNLQDNPDLSQLQSNPATSQFLQDNPDVSRALALSQFPLDNKEERGLTRIDVNGDKFRDIAALNTAYTPDWNEHGIVYQAVTSIEITEDKPDGDTRAVLKQTIGYHDPDWQPNGGRIIFQAKQGSHWEIFSVQPDGGGEQALTRPVTALVDVLPSNVSPTWSPDGRHIAYVSNRDAGEEAGTWRLWVMDADGSNKRPLPVNVTLEYAFNKEQMVSWGQ